MKTPEEAKAHADEVARLLEVIIEAERRLVAFEAESARLHEELAENLRKIETSANEQLAARREQRLELERAVVEARANFALTRSHVRDRVQLVRALAENTGAYLINTVETVRAFTIEKKYLGWIGRINGTMIALPYLSATAFAAIFHSAETSLAENEVRQAIRYQLENDALADTDIAVLTDPREWTPGGDDVEEISTREATDDEDDDRDTPSGDLSPTNQSGGISAASLTPEEAIAAVRALGDTDVSIEGESIPGQVAGNTGD